MLVAGRSPNLLKHFVQTCVGVAVALSKVELFLQDIFVMFLPTKDWNTHFWNSTSPASSSSYFKSLSYLLFFHRLLPSLSLSNSVHSSSSPAEQWCGFSLLKWMSLPTNQRWEMWGRERLWQMGIEVKLKKKLKMKKKVRWDEKRSWDEQEKLSGFNVWGHKLFSWLPLLQDFMFCQDVLGY